jgi:hypothetical protein
MNTSLLPRSEGRIAYEDGRTQANWSFVFPTRPARAGESGSGYMARSWMVECAGRYPNVEKPNDIATAVVRHLRPETAPVA